MRKRKKDEKEISHERYSVDGDSVPFEKVWKLDTPDRLATLGVWLRHTAMKCNLEFGA